jgi:hypothetical protein
VNVTAEIYWHPIAPIRSGLMAAMNQLIDTPRRRKKPRSSTEAEKPELLSGR